jgi:hypothetical protein
MNVYLRASTARYSEQASLESVVVAKATMTIEYITTTVNDSLQRVVTSLMAVGLARDSIHILTGRTTIVIVR